MITRRYLISLLLIVSGLLASGGMLGAQDGWIKVDMQRAAQGEVVIAVDSAMHEQYGLSYPVTYSFQIGGNEVRVFRKYRKMEVWEELMPRTAADFFNGVEAVRLDSSKKIAFVSVHFSALSDSIYLLFTDNGNTCLPVGFLGVSQYYDNRQAAVICSADDWHVYFNEYFQYAMSVFRSFKLWVSAAIVTEWNDRAIWDAIQTQVDSGFVEPVSHGRNHLHVPYPDVGYEVAGSRQDIISNLDLPQHFRKGDREYVYVWVAPYGEYNEAVDSAVAASGYLLTRLYQVGDGDYSGWNAAKGMFDPIGITWEMGPLWGGTTSLTILNRSFDTIVQQGGVYHLMIHPHVLNQYEGWKKSYTWEHLKYISRRSDLWYASIGQFYVYRLVAEGVRISTFVPLAGSSRRPLRPKEFSVFPNPARDQAVLRYYLPETAEMTVSLFDLLGRRVLQVQHGRVNAGYYELPLQLDRLPSGLYFVRLNWGSGQMVRKLQVVH